MQSGWIKALKKNFRKDKKIYCGNKTSVVNITFIKMTHP